MSNVIGAQIPELQGLGTSFSNQAQNVSDLITALNHDVGQTWWQGGAADRFRDSWQTEYQPALQKLVTALEDASNEVNARARALIEVGS